MARKSDQKLLEENNVSQKEAKSIETETEKETSSHRQKSIRRRKRKISPQIQEIELKHACQ